MTRSAPWTAWFVASMGAAFGLPVANGATPMPGSDGAAEVPGDVQSDDKFPKAPAGAPPPTAVEDSTARAPGEMKRYTERLTGTDESFSMTPIRGGEFLMGSPDHEEGRQDGEGPQRQVRVSPFWMSTHEVSWDCYLQFMESLDVDARRGQGAAGVPQDAWADAVSRPTAPYLSMDHGMGFEGFPAISMTHFAARQYSKWLSMKTGRFYRLPTEAEWEYACRAGTTGPYSFAASEVGAHAWWFDNADGKYRKVGQRKPNAFGLHDMHGNVAEWCLDEFTTDGYAMPAGAAAEPLVDPVQWPTRLYPRVVRGGHWDDDRDGLRSAARRGSSDDWKAQDPTLPKGIWFLTDAPWVGIRLVRPLDPPPFEEWGRYHDAQVDSVKKSEALQRRGGR